MKITGRLWHNASANDLVEDLKTAGASVVSIRNIGVYSSHIVIDLQYADSCYDSISRIIEHYFQEWDWL